MAVRPQRTTPRRPAPPLWQIVALVVFVAAVAAYLVRTRSRDPAAQAARSDRRTWIGILAALLIGLPVAIVLGRYALGLIGGPEDGAQPGLGQTIGLLTEYALPVGLALFVAAVVFRLGRGIFHMTQRRPTPFARSRRVNPAE